MPARMVAFDTESRFSRDGDTSVQSWRTGSAIRWRTDLRTGDNAQGAAFNDPRRLYTWVTEFCHPGMRTVVWAHNLGHDIRISQAFRILPLLGWRLEWCNLDRNVSAMTWRSDAGTLVFADTWTWVPLPLGHIAPMTGLVKFDMPQDAAPDESWNDYCMRDTEIVYRAVSSLVRYIKKNNLGNWQPTGAGMAYTTWRHKFMTHKVLVHDNEAALSAERAAMYTGRAEAWQHGQLPVGMWTEVDMRNAYLTIGAECDLPRKLHHRTGALSDREYRSVASRYRVLCRCRVHTDSPVLPHRVDNRFLWPVGSWEGWYWDTELDAAIKAGTQVKVLEAYAYVKDPILRDWAQWVLSVIRTEATPDTVVAQNWILHCSRALIGRLALRTPAWEPFGANPEGITGITMMTDPESGKTHRLMHVGDQTLIETDRKEGRDSLPQVTGWIMAECRRRLWDGMNHAGLDNIAHVDTDSILVNREGLARLETAYGDDFARLWAVKGSWRRLDMYGPRSYIRDGRRVAAGIPLRAEKAGPDLFTGEKWTSLAGDLEAREGVVVTTTEGKWRMRKTDPRRQSAGAGTVATVAYTVADGSVRESSSCEKSAVGS